jgi:hypothetical protein
MVLMIRGLSGFAEVGACLFSKFIHNIRRAEERPQAGRSSGFAPGIPMVKTANARDPHDFGVFRRSRFYRSTYWCIADRSVDSLVVVVVDVLPE